LLKTTEKMKNLLKTKLFALLTFMALFAHTQELDSAYNIKPIANTSIDKNQSFPEIFSTDNILKLIATFIPQNWSAKINNDTLIFFCSSPLYKIDSTLFSNVRIVGKSIIKDTTLIPIDTAKIFFRLESPWAGSRVDDAKSKNSIILSQIDKLSERFKITHLMDYIYSSDFDIQSETISENERKSIVRYFEERKKHESKLIITPDFHTTNYSLFLLGAFPDITDPELYRPTWIISNISEIIHLFSLYAGK
jgi:hypothetical protein